MSCIRPFSSTRRTMSTTPLTARLGARCSTRAATAASMREGRVEERGEKELGDGRDDLGL